MFQQGRLQPSKSRQMSISEEASQTLSLSPAASGKSLVPEHGLWLRRVRDHE